VTRLSEGKWDGNSKTLLLRTENRTAVDDDVTEEKLTIYLLAYFTNNIVLDTVTNKNPKF
jgi:hypothetical protein